MVGSGGGANRCFWLVATDTSVGLGRHGEALFSSTLAFLSYYAVFVASLPNVGGLQRRLPPLTSDS